ncbi:addiction module antidote protein [Deltaproteobacteria bacterium TL4]
MGKRSRDYQTQLIQDLKNPEEAAAYLEVAMEDGTTEEFLLALRNVAEAKGISTISKEANLNRENLYKMLSSNGNPKLSSLVAILKTMGLKLSVESLG